MLSTTEITQMRPISADSHVVEPPSCFSENIDAKFKSRAPFIVFDKTTNSDIYTIPDMVGGRFTLGTVAAAGTPPHQVRWDGKRFEDLHRGGWDSQARLADMDRDSVVAEFIYPTVGMCLMSHPDLEYSRACLQAYNRWLQDYCEGAPDRLFGLGTTAARNPAEMVADLHEIKAMGFKGVMLPDAPGEEDYDSEIYDPVWATAVELDLPLSFHVLPITRASAPEGGQILASRGGKLTAFLNVMRLNQDVVAIFILGGVFDRHPDLKLVCVEADAGWAPHYMYRMDHMYKHHRYWAEATRLNRLPSDYFRDNIYMTFQDDQVAFQINQHMNAGHLLWASDFPHTDATWPDSLDAIRKMAGDVDKSIVSRIVHDNVRELYKLNI